MDSSNRLSTKQNNRKVILDMFRASEVLSVADVSYQKEISKPTVQKVINHFVESGYIIPEGKGESTEDGGKKPQLYSFNNNYGYVICIHLGPDFLYTAITDLKSEILHSEIRQLENLTAEDLTSLCADTIKSFSNNDIVDGRNLIAVSIALPGIVTPEDGSLVFIPHFPEFGYHYPFLEELRKKIEITVPVYCDNINRFQAFAEMKIGQAAGIDNFMIIDAMVEGLGSGIVVKGELKHGAQNFSGEVGHMVLMPHNGPECICGGHGCFEAMVNLKRINKFVEDGREDFPGSLLFKNEQKQAVLERLLAGCMQEDELSVKILDEIAFWFASGINNIVMINDPELIILEGIYNPFGEFFIRHIKHHLQRLAYPGITRSVRIEYSGFGRERGILGAGTHAVWSYFNNSEVYSD